MAEEQKKTLTPEEERLTKCKKELAELLDKYDCILDVGMLITSGRLPQPIVKIIPKPSNLLVPNGAFPMGNVPSGGV